MKLPKFLITLSLFPCAVFAFHQNEKLWLAFNLQKKLSANPAWYYFIYTQTRLVNESHPWQSTLIEGGMGHDWLKDTVVWAGYRWTARNPNNNFFQENRLFQQVIWNPKEENIRHYIIRSRLEEIEHTNQSQIYLRLRERVAIEWRNFFSRDYFPFIYDEIFIPLNQTNYNSSKFINENRLFLGFNLYVSKKDWWEVGYINQYAIKTPQQTANQMSHIVSITYNLV